MTGGNKVLHTVVKGRLGAYVMTQFDSSPQHPLALETGTTRLESGSRERCLHIDSVLNRSQNRIVET